MTIILVLIKVKESKIQYLLLKIFLKLKAYSLFYKSFIPIDYKLLFLTFLTVTPNSDIFFLKVFLFNPNIEDALI